MSFPNHVAIIMDGNRRWAEQRGLPPIEGHRAGAKSMRSTIEYLGAHLKYLTVYGFSTENWTRPPDEVEGLFSLFTEILSKETPELHRRNIRLRHLGSLSKLPPVMLEALNGAVDMTKSNTGLTVNFAVNYGGRQEILNAVRRLADKVTLSEAMALVADPEESPYQKIDEASFSHFLDTDGIPDVDLVIRTGGEIRLSNFLLWQTAYSEFYFTEILWPDFTTEEIEKALSVYSGRKRRFGGD